MHAFGFRGWLECGALRKAVASALTLPAPARFFRYRFIFSESGGSKSSMPMAASAYYEAGAPKRAAGEIEHGSNRRTWPRFRCGFLELGTVRPCDRRPAASSRFRGSRLIARRRAFSAEPHDVESCTFRIGQIDATPSAVAVTMAAYRFAVRTEHFQVAARVIDGEQLGERIRDA